MLITSLNLISQAIIGLITVERGQDVPMLYYTVHNSHLVCLASLCMQMNTAAQWKLSTCLAPRVLPTAKINEKSWCSYNRNVREVLFSELYLALLRKYINWLSLNDYFIGNSIVGSEIHLLIPNSMAA